MKKKEEKYWIALAEKLIKAGVIGTEKLSEIVSETNVSFGFKALENKGSIYMALKELRKIYGDDFEIQKIETTGSDGRKIKNGNFYSLKQVNRARIYNHFGVSPTKIYSGTTTPQDLEHRNAYLRVANKTMEQNPGMSKEDAVMQARRKVQRLTKEMVNAVWTVMPKMKAGESIELSRKDVEFFGKSVIDTFSYYGVNLGIEVISRRAIKFNRDMAPVAREVMDLAQKVLKLKLKMPVVEKKSEIILQGNEGYVALVIGGLIMKNDGKFVEIHKITGALRNNHYHTIDMSGHQIEELIKKVPHLFQKVGGNGINLVGDRKETWDKIQEQYSPYNQEWIIPWCVNSDITLNEIQYTFPKSWQEREDINVGSRIIMIKLDRSIRSFMSLAKLNEKFRGGTDFPIGEPGLVEKLDKESIYIDSATLNFMLGKTTTAEEWRGNSDRLLLQIEEGCI